MYGNQYFLTKQEPFLNTCAKMTQLWLWRWTQLQVPQGWHPWHSCTTPPPRGPRCFLSSCPGGTPGTAQGHLLGPSTTISLPGTCSSSSASLWSHRDISFAAEERKHCNSQLEKYLRTYDGFQPHSKTWQSDIITWLKYAYCTSPGFTTNISKHWDAT